jgi:OTU domain-containing protein 5
MALKGLKIVEMEGDGNCLFRAISDQIYNGD